MTSSYLSQHRHDKNFKQGRSDGCATNANTLTRRVFYTQFVAQMKWAAEINL